MTINEIRRRLQELEITPKKSLGQNFLVGDRVVKAIIGRTQSLKPQGIIEVGPGLGALTDELREMGVPLLLIELDHQLARHWREQKLNVMEHDALRVDWNDIPACRGTIVVSNLPYQISSSLLVDRSVAPGGVTGMVLMFQKEVARRIRAAHAHSDYGLLSVIAQSYWDIDLVVEAAPAEFFPVPKIASRVLEFRAKTGPQPAKMFLKFVKTAFSQRRKHLASNLTAWKSNRKKAQITEIFEQLAFSPTVRAEQLTVAQFHLLFDRLESTLPEGV